MKTAAIALLLCSAPALAAPCGTPQACAAGCDRHDAHACNDLAVMFEEGRGVPKDLPKAAMLYEVACNHGVLEACSFFATFLYNGEVVPKDVARAAVLLKRACDGGNVAESCEHLKAVAAAAAREQRATTTCDGVNDTYRRLKQDRGFDSRAGLDDDLALLHGIKRPRGMGEPLWRSCVQTLDQKLRKQSAEAQEYLATHRDSPAEKRRRKCERDCFYANLSAHESTADMCRQQCR
jgi:TPR repeat protein